MMWQFENKRVMVIGIMGLSVAFDIVDHGLLLCILQHRFDVNFHASGP